MGYALVVGAALARQARKRVTRMAGLAYPLLVLLVIVATGNHYFFDAFAGALVAAIASALASAITNQSAASAARPAATTTPPPRVTALPVPAVTHIRHERSEQKLAA
jgi:membrane-associated phospholipid phosphatase